MRKISRIGLPIIVLMLLLSGCAAQSASPRAGQIVQRQIAQAAATAADTPAPVDQPASVGQPAPQVQSTDSPAPASAVAVEAAPAGIESAVPAGTDVYKVASVVSAEAVYSAPDAAASAVGQVDAGSEVVVTRAIGDWYEIVYLDAPGSHAWIQQSALSLDSEAAPAAPAASPTEAATPAQPASKVTPAPAAASAPVSARQPAPVKSSGLSGALVFRGGPDNTTYYYDLKTRTLRRLTGGLDPALSPDGRTVAFVRQDGEQGLYLINTDGTGERRIYGGSRDLRTPSWSPDGQYILFSRVNGEEQCRQVGPRCVPDRPGLEKFPLVTLDKRGLSRVNPDGSDFRDIPAMETAMSPDWNAAGIVYAAAEGLQLTADLSDASSRSLLDARNYSVQDPNWQPDEARIIFQKREGTHWEIYAINPDGTGETALTHPVSVLVDELPQSASPVWSPDGLSIAYLSNREADGSAGKWRIWVMDADGGNQRPLDPDVLGNIEFRYDNSADQVIDWS